MKRFALGPRFRNQVGQVCDLPTSPGAGWAGHRSAPLGAADVSFGNWALVAALVIAALTLSAQAPANPILSLTATTENVAGAPDSIRIDLFRWSTGAERDQLVAAWTNPAAPAAGGRGGRAGGRGAAGRGA